MRKYKVLETFSGIGAQHRALDNLKRNNILDFQIVGTSDWDVYAVLTYAAIHHHKEYKLINSPTDDELDIFAKNNTFSTDGSQPIRNINRIPKEVLIDWYKAFKVTNNIGSIVNSFSRIKDLIIENKGIDLLTYSFPCTDLSTAGNFHGFNEGITPNTRSGLLLEIEKTLIGLSKEQETITSSASSPHFSLMPKYLLLENVPNLVRKQHRHSFDHWLKKLNKLGYKTIWGLVDSSDFNMVQKRKRVYALSIFDPNNDLKWEKYHRGDLEIELKNILKNNKYEPLNKQKISKLIDFNNKTLFGGDPSFEYESEWSRIPNTPSRVYMVENSKKITRETTHISTVTTKQDRYPNCGWVSYQKQPNEDSRYLDQRFITPLEAYLLMGFSKEDYKKARTELISKTLKFRARTYSQSREKLYKQAGNSVAVNVLEIIFYYMNYMNTLGEQNEIS